MPSFSVRKSPPATGDQLHCKIVVAFHINTIAPGIASIDEGRAMSEQIRSRI